MLDVLPGRRPCPSWCSASPCSIEWKPLAHGELDVLGGDVVLEVEEGGGPARIDVGRPAPASAGTRCARRSPRSCAPRRRPMPPRQRRSRRQARGRGRNPRRRRRRSVPPGRSSPAGRRPPRVEGGLPRELREQVHRRRPAAGHADAQEVARQRAARADRARRPRARGDLEPGHAQPPFGAHHRMTGGDHLDACGPRNQAASSRSRPRSVRHQESRRRQRRAGRRRPCRPTNRRWRSPPGGPARPRRRLTKTRRLSAADPGGRCRRRASGARASPWR